MTERTEKVSERRLQLKQETEKTELQGLNTHSRLVKKKKKKCFWRARETYDEPESNGATEAK